MSMTMPRGRGRPRKNIPQLTAAQKELVQIRQQLGMTQEELAQALDVAADTVSRWERGERRVSSLVLQAAQRLLSSRTSPPLLTNTYTITMTPAPEGGYSVVCLEVPGAISQGGTVEEAREMITEAIQMLNAYRRDKERKQRGPGAWEETLEVSV